MACREYECDCGFFTITNRRLNGCPKCGGPLRWDFDESRDHGNEDDYHEEESEDGEE